MDDLMRRIEQAKQMIEEKEDQEYSDYIIYDLLRDIEDAIREKN